MAKLHQCNKLNLKKNVTKNFSFLIESFFSSYQESSYNIYRTLRLIINFYTSFALVSWIITIVSVIIIYTNGIRVFIFLFWIKIISFGLIFYYINEYKKFEFYYYKNLGLSKRFLWITIFSFELILFITLLLLTMKIKW